MRFRVEGSQSDIEALHAELSGDTGLPLTDVVESTSDSVTRAPLGLEPIMHFFVAVAAHLTAAVIHDVLTATIASMRSRGTLSDSDVNVDQDAGSNDETSRP